MINFNKVLTSKIISLAIAVSFLMADISYAAGAYQQGSLRVPMGQRGAYKRVGGVMDEQREVQPHKTPLIDPAKKARFKRVSVRVFNYENVRLEKARAALKYIKKFFEFEGKFDQAMLKEMHERFQTLPNDKKLEFNRHLLKILYDKLLKETSPGKKAGRVKSVGKVIAVEGSTIVDLSIRFERLSKLDGELSPWMYMVKPGSTGPNSARVINNLGRGDLSIRLYGFSDDFQGIVFLKELEGALNRVDLETIFLKGNSRTSLFAFAPDTENPDPDAAPLELHMRPSNPELTEEQGRSLMGDLKELPPAQHREFVILGGPVFAGLKPDEFYTPCVQMLQEKGYRVLADFKPYMQVEEMDAVVRGSPEAIKMNLEEFSRFVNRYFQRNFGDLKKEQSIPQIASMALRIAQEHEIGFLVVSMEELGAVIAYHDGPGKGLRAVYIPAPKITLESSVGSGDSQIGAIVWRLTLDETQGKEPDYIEAFLGGVAAGSATAEKPGTEVTGAQRFGELLEVMKKAPDGSVHFLEVKPFEPATQLIEAEALQNAKETRTGI